jgi:hypothetical protein
MKIAVSERAVFKRLQRYLLAKGKYLRNANRGKQEREGLGRYYLVDAKGVVDKDVDIEKMARELALLDPWETLE